MIVECQARVLKSNPGYGKQLEGGLQILNKTTESGMVSVIH